MHTVVCVFAAALAAFTAASARAQGGEPGMQVAAHRWLVVPTLGGEPRSEGGSIEQLHITAEALRQELVVRGHSVWRADRASERFEVLGSAPAPTISQSDIDLWVERSRAAVRYLARADYKAARRELKAAQRLANRAAAELNREAARAQQVLDTCLFMVRAYVETQNDAEARKQARECRRLVPRVEPSAFRHTPEVRELLAQVDQQMASEAPGTLEVRSTPSDCVVRINGVEFGRTPLSNIELPVGTYRMQVECEQDKRGRIHRVGISSGPNLLEFNAALERAVRTRPVLHLQYDSHEAWSERMGQASGVGNILGGADILVLTAQGAGSIRVDLSALKYEPASAWLAVRYGAPETEDVRRVMDALLEGRSVDFTGPHPMARASWRAERAPQAEFGAATAAVVEPNSKSPPGVPRPRNQRIAGWSLLGVGAASIGTSVGLHLWRGKVGDRFTGSPDDLSAAQQWNNARIGVWATAAFGGAATSAAMPLILPNHQRTPWWGWTLGAVGLGLTGYAIYEGVTMTGCPDPYIADEAAVRSCVARGQETGRLSLALAGAAPLLSIPLVYLFRPLRVEPSVSATRQGALIRVRKAF
ncbi:MAG: PEGA domain-containing protein [Myxococcales bacterium]|nr:PEGA domain-containing protein [Deltaproteobacteria bacterium]NND29748.1 PEGA domain-containing protein [Myxococcales bacterium]MBT8480168.1 PEGA domain-containing protein [Deltaproteobacteria bacterium]NNK09586.1 PEGA domain-containing protein [Myxococcales bacterium]NNK43111.1 PEGA domain-containing protein [Myxococcales bacterium]